MIVRVFEYKKALFIEDVCTKHELRQLFQSGVIIGWICKNNIKGLDGFPQEPESISSKDPYLVELHVSAGLLDKFEVQGSHFNGKDGACSPGGKLKAYAAGTGEQVQYVHFLNIVLMNQNVKEAFFCKIGSGSGFEISRGTDLFTS